jgi:hypothetical protein
MYCDWHSVPRHAGTPNAYFKKKEGLNDMLFQDGAPPHFHKEVTDFLNSKFPEKCIGRGWPITWQPRSPDLTPLDFFFWGFIKDAVYVPPLATTLPELAGRIRDAVATVTLNLLNNMCTETKYRHDICWVTHGALIVSHKNLPKYV